MIFTDKFVYLHQPKTGGTFVTSALYRLHVEGVRQPLRYKLRNRFRKHHLHKSRFGSFVYSKNKHGTSREIPAGHRGKPILASVRNPYDWWVSEYEFGWWKRKEFAEERSDVRRALVNFPRYPELTFAEFLELSNTVCRPFASPLDSPRPGRASQLFAVFYFGEPQLAIARMDDEYVASKGYRGDFAEETYFLRTNTLNRDLHEFLLGMDYPASDIEFVLGMERVLPFGKGRSGEQKWQRYFTPELKEIVRRKEALIFSMFPEFDE